MVKVFERKPGDMVWVMYDNRAVFGCIKSIFFCKGYNYLTNQTFDGNEQYKVYLEDKCIGDFTLKDMFSTKQELIDSL